MRANNHERTTRAQAATSLFLLALVVLMPAAAAAQSAPGHTAALPKTAGVEPAKSELRAGGVHAKLAPIPTDTTFAAGNAAFATLTVTGQTARPAVAEVVLETEGAEIRAVTGKAVNATDQSEARAVVVTQPLRKGRPQTMLVEVGLNGSDAAASNTTLNRLRITLRQPGTAKTDSTVVTWAVADCAGGFHDRLLAIKASTGDRMLPALKAATARDRERPGRWLFRPNLGSAGKRQCARWTQSWDFLAGRFRSRCVRYVSRQVTAKPDDVSAGEKKLYAFANRFVAAGAIDPELKDTRDNGWAAKRITNDLTRYLRQDKHPALCTGVLDYVAYFDGKLDGLRQRADAIAEQTGNARTVVQERLAALADAVAAAPAGHPGWGATPLEASQPAPRAPLKDVIVAVAALMGEDDLAQSVKQADSTMSALKLMQDAFKRSPDAEDETPPAGVIAAARRTLGAVEAADYLAAVEAQYAALRGSIDGSIAAIREAHENQCGCGG